MTEIGPGRLRSHATAIQQPVRLPAIPVATSPPANGTTKPARIHGGLPPINHDPATLPTSPATRPLNCENTDRSSANRHVSALPGQSHAMRLFMSSMTARVGAGSGEVPGRTLFSRLPVCSKGVALSWRASWPGAAARRGSRRVCVQLEIALPVLAGK